MTVKDTGLAYVKKKKSSCSNKFFFVYYIINMKEMNNKFTYGTRYHQSTIILNHYFNVLQIQYTV